MADPPKASDTGPGTSGSLPGPLAPGVILQNRYRIERLLGGGGMGMVYLAHDQRLSNRPCAIKEMVDHFIDPQQRIEANEYFAREADTLAQLKHAAIPAITDRFDDQNRHYLVMEYVEGRNLEEELAERGAPLPEGLVIDVARQLCDVLAYLHGLSPPVIYRDMKPSNVMLTASGRVVLVDFGIARLFKAQRKGTMIGTLGFAPPEQYQGVADPRSDIYSLGATLHYVLTGRDPEKFPPFSFPPVREVRPNVSRNLAGAIDRALAYDMSGRPATINDFRDMMLYGTGLDAAVGIGARQKTGGLSLPPTATLPMAEPVSLPPPRRRRSRRRRLVTLLTLVVVLGGAAFGATYIYQDPQLQTELGIKPWIDNLPWKHQELVAEAERHPLDFEQLTVALSSRSGEPLGPPRASFTDIELLTNKYIKWDATFKNDLAGLASQNGHVEARFYNPTGVQIASSSDDRFIAPSQSMVDFGGVALIDNSDAITPGPYRVALYSGDNLLGQAQFSVSEDLAAKEAAAKARAEADAAAAAASAAAAKKSEEDRRLAILQERMRDPLHLERIEFLNTTKDGTVISGPSDHFAVSKVLFVAWRTVFQNRLFGLSPNQYRVDASYIAPDGTPLGAVHDVRAIAPTDQQAVFSGRVGNSAGGAFLPGLYTVNFYLNGQYLTQKKFRVIADTGAPYSGTSSYSPAGGGYGGGYSSSSFGGASGPALPTDLPTLATGTIEGIGGHPSAGLELRLRPQPNGFLHGEMVVEIAGYGTTPIEGFVRGDSVNFTVLYGAQTYAFKGHQNGDTLSGTFEAMPLGESGTWTAQAN